MNNWKEYINHKFQPKSNYKFDDGTNDLDNGIFKITHLSTKTTFCFIYPYEDWKKIDDIQFYNSKTKGWSGEFRESEYSKSEKEKLDEFLKPAMELGWSSKDFYIFGKHFQSNVYWNKKFDGKSFQYFTRFGCSWIVLFPFLWMITKLMEWKIINGMKKIIIEPTN